jgi:antitoxin (DNA-binding transcriptional repressor) of toxin-antitoxin stability system
MTQVTIREAEAHLSELIQKALAGEEIVIADGKRSLVKLVVVPEQRNERRIGGAKGVVTYMAEDFDAPLSDFEPHSS